MKHKIDFKNNVSETLLIPLWMRAIDPVLQDEYSRKIVDSINYDFEKFSIDKGSQQGVRIRTLYFQHVIEHFIDEHEHPIVVMLGCGLDPQSQRITNRNKALFYALDLPDVIDLRRHFLSSFDYERYISASAYDPTWMDEIVCKHVGASFLFIAEGLMIYFAQGDNQLLIKHLALRFPNAEIYFERMSKFAVKNQVKHKSISQMSASFCWGVDNPQEICQWVEGLECIANFKYLHHAKGFYGMIGRIVPALGNSCGIYGFRFPNHC